MAGKPATSFSISLDHKGRVKVEGFTSYTTVSDARLTVFLLLLGVGISHWTAFWILSRNIGAFKYRLMPLSCLFLGALALILFFSDAILIYAYWIYSAVILGAALILSRGGGRSPLRLVITVAASMAASFILGFLAMVASFVAR